MTKFLLIAFIFFLFGCRSISDKKNQVKFDHITKETSDTSIIFKENYKNGKTKYVIYKKDSLINNVENCEELHITFSENGMIVEKGCQGHYGVWGVPVGTWFTYDSLGKIKEKVFYKHDSVNGYKKTSYFGLNGKIIKEIVVGYDPDFGELDSIWSEK